MLLLLQEGLAGRAAQVQHRARGPGERVQRRLQVRVQLLRVVPRVVLRDHLLRGKPRSHTALASACVLRVSRGDTG